MNKNNLTNRESKIIREAKIEDVGAILDIQRRDGFNHDYYLTSERVNNLFSKGQKFYLIENDVKPVGFACADFDIRTWLHFLSISKDFQGRGNGSVLLNKIIEESKSRRINLIYFIAEKNAIDIEKFLRKHRFEEAGFHRNRFGLGRDGIIWNLRLEK